MDIFSGYVYNLCMMPVMVKEADLNRLDVPEVFSATEDHDVIQSTASIIKGLRDRVDLAAGTGTVHGRSTNYRPAP
jgi:hypothetical protein